MSDTNPLSFLDKWAAWARHLFILAVVAPVAALVVSVATGIVTSGGFSDVDFGTVFAASLDLAAVSLASGILGWVALFITPLTRQYGVGKDG